MSDRRDQIERLVACIQTATNAVRTAQRADYTALAECLEQLPTLVQWARHDRKLSLRAAARQVGCGFNTLARLERGEAVALVSAVAIVRWLAGDPDE